MGIIITIIIFHLGLQFVDANGILDISSAAVECFFFLFLGLIFSLDQVYYVSRRVISKVRVSATPVCW